MKFTKPKLTKEETENSTLIGGYFNTTFSATDRNLAQISKVQNFWFLMNVVNHLDLLVFIEHYSQQLQNTFSSAHDHSGRLHGGL